MAPVTVNIFVVDSHAIYRRGLVASLELLDAVDVVNQADSAEAAWKHPAFADADVVIVDPSIAGGATFLVAVVEDTGAHAIACTSDGDEDVVRAALASGVVGYLRKDALTHEVLEAALAAAGAGAAVVAVGVLVGTMRDIATRALRESAPRPASPLSDREQRVLTLIAEGHLTRDVATELCYSERTVKNVLHDVATKLNARSRSHAIAYAVREGLI
jgi:DNA-binding NarL/FixJ family response regulator